MIHLQNKPLMLAAQFLKPFLDFEWSAKGASLEYSVGNGIAVIHITGLLTKRDEMFFGTTSYDDIRKVVSQALDDNKVETILLDIDSPGGEVGGLFDLVDFIYRARDKKPIYAYANDSAFSAAYAIASACSKIFVNRTGGVGSIGVIATHLDVSGADKKEGLKYTSIYAGDKKNDLSPHEPLSEKAKDEIQEEVNRLYEMFVSTVSRNRGISPELIKATQAATYYGENAINIGLADELTGNPIEIIQTKFGVMSSNMSISVRKGANMTEEIEKTETGEAERYKVEILEITQLCKLAHAEDEIPEFIRENLSASQVREKLLAKMQSQEEIFSVNHRKDDVKENPVVAAAKKRLNIN